VNVVTLNPLINLPKYQNNKPFITKEKRPRVIILIGRVRTLIMGFMNILNSVKHAPTTSATQSGSTLMPFTINVVAKTAIEISIQCKIIFIPLEIGNL